MKAKRWKTGITCLVAALAVLVVGCEITRTPGGIRIVPAPGEDPGIGGYWREITINGKCYYSNGHYCIPCGGGKMRPCSDYIDITEPDPNPEVFEANVAFNLSAQFFQLTGGLTGEEYLLQSGLLFWLEGEEVILPIEVNYFTDEGSGYADVSFLWKSDWTLPELPANGVEVSAFVDGNFDDEEPDLMLIRAEGPAQLVYDLLEPLHELGTLFEVVLDDGTVWP